MDEITEVTLQAGALVLGFSSGFKSSLQASKLQSSCPCVLCSDSEKIADSYSKVLRVEQIGNYALQFRFSKGCSKGIYSYEKIRELCLEQ